MTPLATEGPPQRPGHPGRRGDAASNRTAGRRRTLSRCGAALCGGALLLTACADEAGGPDGETGDQINLIVPFDAGGSADGTARQLASQAERTCGTSIVISNETGGSGTVGFQSVASAAPDGTTIGVAAIELSILPHLGVSPIGPDDIRGIMQYSEQPVAFGVPPDSDIEDASEVLTTDRDITVASSGTGSIYHVGFAGAAVAAGQDNLRNVPYDGAAPAVQAALGEETDMVTVGAAEMVPYVEGGQLRPLAVADSEPVDILPDTPTLAEYDVDWTSYAILGLFAPAGTPDETIRSLNECFNEARESEDFTEYMDTLGFTQEYKDAEEFDTYLQEEYERYGDVVDDLGLGQD